MIVTNKRYSYSRVVAIWINIHSVGENPINTPHAFHARFAYDPRPYISCSPCRQPFVSPHKDMPLHPEVVLATEDRLARPSPWVASLPHDSLGVWERGFDQVVTQLHQLTWPITSACDRYVQYLLVRPNPSVLNWHRRGLQPWRCQLSTHHSSTFPANGPPIST
jgi:hypothetical protein